MLDDFREWLSDNLRYILLGLAVLLVLIIGFCVVRLIRGSSGRDKTGDAQQQAVVQQEVATEAPAEADKTVTTVQTPAVSELVKDDAAVLTLIQKYYQARVDKDVTTLSGIVTPWNDQIQESILKNEDIEGYSNIATYSKDGLEEGSYVVFAYSDSKVVGIETPVPGLALHYLLTDETGTLKICGDPDSDKAISDYIASVSKDADVQSLINDVKAQYEAQIAADADLRAYVDAHNNSGSSANAEENQQSGGEGGQSRVMTATAGLNIRETPSTEAAILGGVLANTNVTVLEEVENGWCHISYDSNGTTIEGYVMLQYLQETEAN